MKIQVNNPEAVVKEMFWLAWTACGGPVGMGVLQDRPGITKEDVWVNVNTGKYGGDYPSGEGIITPNANRPGRVTGDYVFGRMMKLRVEWDTESITVSDCNPHPDYQSWCRIYPTYQALVAAAVQNVG